MAFVLFRHQQHGFCFVPTSTKLLWFCSGINKMFFIFLQHQQQLVKQGEVAWISTRQIYINQISTKSETDFTGEARQWSELGSIKDYSLYSGPPLQVELQSSGGNGVGEYHGSKLGLYEMMPADVKSGGQRVYRQLHHDIKGKDIKQWYLYRWVGIKDHTYIISYHHFCLSQEWRTLVCPQHRS